MGLRLHKAIGYAKTLTIEEYETYTNQINNFAEKLDNDDKLPIKQYVSFLNNKYKDTPSSSIDYIYARSFKKIPQQFEQITISEIFSFIKTTVGNDSNHSILLISLPFQHQEWFRVDNGIDFVNHFQHFDEPQNVVSFLDKALYPFNSSLMNKETGEIIPVSSRHKVLMSLYSNDNATDNKDILDTISLQDYNMPFEQIVQNYTVASVPVEVQDLMEWVGLASPTQKVNQTFCPAVAEWWD